jgi:hypothetical protein
MVLLPKQLKLMSLLQLELRIKITLFELDGIIISLKIYFNASANDCK